MRKPALAENIDQCKKLAKTLFQSEDWRCKFLAVYYLSFYMKPLEIVGFLESTPTQIDKYMRVLKAFRKDRTLIRRDTLKEVLKIATN